MGLKKCPICELNYIEEKSEMCDICRRARKGGDNTDEYTVCVACGEHPAVSDTGLCAVCLHQHEVLHDDNDPNISSEMVIDPVGNVSIDSGLESMELPIEDEDAIPESEYKQIAHDLELDNEDEEDEGEEYEYDDEDEEESDQYDDPIGVNDYVEIEDGKTPASMKKLVKIQ